MRVGLLLLAAPTRAAPPLTREQAALANLCGSYGINAFGMAQDRKAGRSFTSALQATRQINEGIGYTAEESDDQEAMLAYIYKKHPALTPAQARQVGVYFCYLRHGVMPPRLAPTPGKRKEGSRSRDHWPSKWCLKASLTTWVMVKPSRSAWRLIASIQPPSTWEARTYDWTGTVILDVRLYTL
jgi:hypothetical protein